MITKILSVICILLLGYVVYLHYISELDTKTYQNELAVQATTVTALKDSLGTIAQSYVEISSDLNDKVKELSGKNTLLKKMFGKNSELENIIEKKDLELNSLTTYNFMLNAEINNLKGTLQKDSSWKAIYAPDEWLSMELYFKTGIFNVKKISIKNELIIISGKQDNGILTAFVENRNPYVSGKQELKFALTEAQVAPSFFEKYKFETGILTGISLAGIIWFLAK